MVQKIPTARVKDNGSKTLQKKNCFPYSEGEWIHCEGGK